MNEIYDIFYDEISCIRDLWEKNREYHEKISEYFKDSYRNIDFNERIKTFSAFNKETMKITVVKSKDEFIGYCISAITDGKGEIATLHVNKVNRGNGIGKNLVDKHIKWMKEKNCKVIGVTVSQENESAIKFYKKMGFYSNTLYMQYK